MSGSLKDGLYGVPLPPKPSLGRSQRTAALQARRLVVDVEIQKVDVLRHQIDLIDVENRGDPDGEGRQPRRTNQESSHRGRTEAVAPGWLLPSRGASAIAPAGTEPFSSCLGAGEEA